MSLVRISGTGSFQGNHVVDNCALFPKIIGFDRVRAEETVRKKGNSVDGLSDAELFDLWVRQVCGVEKRVYFNEEDLPEGNPEGEHPRFPAEYMGYRAGQSAIEAAGVSPDSIEYVIFSSFTPNQLIPNPACTISNYLGIKGAGGVQLNTACSGFLDGIGLARMMIQSGNYKRILVVASEHMSPHIDFHDITTSILFGDGAAAAVVEESDSESGILSYVAETDYNPDMISMEYGKCLRMEGGALVQRNAVNSMHGILEKALKQASQDFSNLRFLVPHQANLRILQRLADKVGIPYERMVQSVVTTGNTSAAAIGIGLDRLMRGQLKTMAVKEGDLLGLTVVGGGYTFSGMVYRI